MIFLMLCYFEKNTCTVFFVKPRKKNLQDLLVLQSTLDKGTSIQDLQELIECRNFTKENLQILFRHKTSSGQVHNHASAKMIVKFTDL